MRSPEFKELIINPILICCFLFLFHQLHANNNLVSPSDSTSLVSKIMQEYGPDQLLVNGLHPEDSGFDVLGHPFLGGKEFYPGYIVVHGRKFDGLFLKYNLFEQNVVVSETGPDRINYQVIPPNKFISEFEINGKLFRKYRFNPIGEKFYQVVYDGSIKCLRYFFRKRYESYHDLNYLSYKFGRETVQSYLLIGDKPHEFQKTGSFLSCFPEDIRPEVRAYIKREKFRINRMTDTETVKLLRYCEELTRKDRHP